MTQLVPWTVEKVGQSFVDHYAQLGYKEIPGSSLRTPALPMTFVMSAGMVQFEKLAPTAQAGDRYVLIQNCFRHVDIEQVDKSSFHISLFQMPGAFSFGQIDHQTCIEQIWTLLVEAYGFDPQNLFVTYFIGGQLGGHELPADNATASAWLSVGLSASHLIGLGSQDNFWQQSHRMVGLVNSRKCGPNTEVFFDRGEQFGCGGPGCRPGCRCGRFVEFLNLLFICMRITDEGGIVSLENAFTEVVIGRERVTALLNHLSSIYEVNTLRPLIQHVNAFASNVSGDNQHIRYQRILVDHLRALLFLVQDGAPKPGRGGQARLMRILSRELLASLQLLGISDRGFLRSLTMLALELYPHLTNGTQERLLGMLVEEQSHLDRTLQKGFTKLDLLLSEGREIKPRDLVSLYKNSGIPIELLSYILWQKNIPIDWPSYQIELDAFLQAIRSDSG